MVSTRTITVNKWGGALGIRLPKDFVEKAGISEKEQLQTKIVGKTLVLYFPEEKRSHIPLAERMKKAIEDGTWNGKPYQLTDEDKEWDKMPAVGEEIPW